MEDIGGRGERRRWKIANWQPHRRERRNKNIMTVLERDTDKAGRWVYARENGERVDLQEAFHRK